MATAEIRGHKVEIDENAAKSWKAYKLFRSFERAESDFDKGDVALELAELFTGLDADAIAALCGGDSAPVEEVLGFTSEVIAAAIPKN